MMEFVKAHYFDIAVVIVAIYLLMKVKRMAQKVIGITFSLAAIARVIVIYTNLHN
ncbi:hypothetical protein [Paenibacillus oralis]|uniref:hypothetical protein n=1 Tax=Paenibacillus oralis TaxID=2490856 RepID=UPI0015B20F0D|nr:hypothetical protein [Paenibacillus oralis]